MVKMLRYAFCIIFVTCFFSFFLYLCKFCRLFSKRSSRVVFHSIQNGCGQSSDVHSSLMFTLKVFRVNLKVLRRFIWTVETVGDDLVLRENNNEELCFPHLWLRDNCQCSSCFHKTSNSRIIDIEHFDFTSKPLTAIVNNNSSLEVCWSDNHKSHFSLPWLLSRQFTSKNRAQWLNTQYRPQQQPWPAEQFLSTLQRYTYKDIIDNDKVLQKWLESIAVDGVAIIEGASKQPGQLQALANRVTFLKRTYYGETFTVRAKPGTSNVAYLSGALQLHTDLPYYQYKPGVNMLHCILQGNEGGGESQLSDGLSVCHWLRDNHPQHYWILTTVPVEWEDIVQEDGKDYHSIYRAPVICVEGGEVVRINFSQPQRGSHFNIPVEQVTPWYRSLELFSKRMHSLHNKVHYKLTEGEILTFDNIRVFHGRSTYEGDRHLEGGYLDWDYVYSKIRVLRKTNKQES